MTACRTPELGRAGQETDKVIFVQLLQRKDGRSVAETAASERLTPGIAGAPQGPSFATSATMLQLKARRRAVLVETFRELANLSAGALVLRQFVAQQPLSFLSILVGAATWVALDIF